MSRLIEEVVALMRLQRWQPAQLIPYLIGADLIQQDQKTMNCFTDGDLFGYDDACVFPSLSQVLQMQGDVVRSMALWDFAGYPPYLGHGIISKNSRRLCHAEH